MFNITSGINQVGPVFGPAQMGQTMQRMRNPPMGMPQFPSQSHYSPATNAEFGQQFGDMMRQGGNSMAINFGRQAAPINAQQNLAGQQARAQSGIQWANLLANQHGADLNSRMMANNALMNLLRSFL